MIQHLFPSILIALDVCASVVYFIHRKPLDGGYWLSAAILSALVVAKSIIKG